MLFADRVDLRQLRSAKVASLPSIEEVHSLRKDFHNLCRVFSNGSAAEFEHYSLPCSTLVLLLVEMIVPITVDRCIDRHNAKCEILRRFSKSMPAVTYG